jgi:hypothetical protein
MRKELSKFNGNLGVRRSLIHCVAIVLAAFGLLFHPATARAACGNMTGGATFKMPPMLLGGANLNAGDDEHGSPSIVGLWHVLYTTDAHQPFNETLDQWHGDGTEFENATLPPAVGNICFGVWKEIAPRTVKLHHVGWLFNPNGSLAGSFSLDEVNTVAKSGKSYKGTFVFRTYNTAGVYNPGSEVKGTISAARITVD